MIDSSKICINSTSYKCAVDLNELKIFYLGICSSYLLKKSFILIYMMNAIFSRGSLNSTLPTSNFYVRSYTLYCWMGRAIKGDCPSLSTPLGNRIWDLFIMGKHTNHYTRKVHVCVCCLSPVCSCFIIAVLYCYLQICFVHNMKVKRNHVVLYLSYT